MPPVKTEADGCVLERAPTKGGIGFFHFIMRFLISSPLTTSTSISCSACVLRRRSSSGMFTCSHCYFYCAYTYREDKIDPHKRFICQGGGQTKNEQMREKIRKLLLNANDPRSAGNPKRSRPRRSRIEIVPAPVKDPRDGFSVEIV